MQDQVVVAQRQKVSDRIQRRVGFEGPTKYQRMIVQARSASLPICGYYIEPGVRTQIDVPLADVARIKAMVELDGAAILKAKAHLEARIDEEIAKRQLDPAKREEHARLMPYSVESEFYVSERRNINPLTFAETVGDPFIHDDREQNGAGGESDKLMAMIEKIADRVLEKLSGGNSSGKKS